MQRVSTLLLTLLLLLALSGCGVLNSRDGDRKAAFDNFVITSYSIHYTKLYEALAKQQLQFRGRRSGERRSGAFQTAIGRHVGLPLCT